MLLYSFLSIRGEKQPTALHWRTAFYIGTLLLLGGNGGVVWAEQKVSSGLTALLVSVAPLWMAFLIGPDQRVKNPRRMFFLDWCWGLLGLYIWLALRPFQAHSPCQSALSFSYFHQFSGPLARSIRGKRLYPHHPLWQPH